MTEFRGRAAGDGLRVCIVVSRFNLLVTERLLDGARETLLERGVAEADLDVVYVPGAWELAAAARAAVDRGYDAIVAVGAVIRGETAHFEHVSHAAMDGLARVQRETGVPIGLGLLTPENMAQAMARAGGEVGNAGVQAAEAALDMANLLRRLRGG
ncbi:MAG: 6,7-dimethyl-8-ribityllumazine synthase [Gemmatimonadota bacterium]|nr:6,7-dimethyl-8-ribityllumazine synthase [Gemmatimonadota bacterium]